jgi:hypothetical protein
MKLLNVEIDFSSLAKIKWYEYAIRFAFGGAITVAAGLIAKRWGPEYGGLFLAFPAIFPASATLVEKKEKEKKAKAGIDGASRGRILAGLDAAGAALGSLGLVAFAIVVWSQIADHSAWMVLLSATLTWMAVAGVLWYLRKTKYGMRFPRSRHQQHQNISSR